MLDLTMRHALLIRQSYEHQNNGMQQLCNSVCFVHCFSGCWPPHTQHCMPPYIESLIELSSLGRLPCSCFEPTRRLHACRNPTQRARNRASEVTMINNKWPLVRQLQSTASDNVHNWTEHVTLCRKISGSAELGSWPHHVST